MMLRILAIVLLTGCASDPVWLENRVACTADEEELHVISKWGPIEFGSEIAKADAKAICKKSAIPEE